MCSSDLILSGDGYLPRQLHTRGDRLAYSNGILVLAVMAMVLVWAFHAEVNLLIPLYTVGVFVSFTVSQFGMIRHWSRLLGQPGQDEKRGTMLRSRVINTIGFALTGTVLTIVLITKFTLGAWIACVAMAALFVLMKGIRRHYDSVARELQAAEQEPMMLPSRIKAVVLVSKIHKPTLRALSYARATRASSIEAITVSVDEEETAALMAEWQRRGIPVPLKALHSPYREITRPIIDYVRELRRESPRDVVTVYIPEYVVGRWWEQLLHNQSALRLKSRLLFTPGVMVTSVPWQLASSALVEQDDPETAPGAVRRGTEVAADPWTEE